jgi:hypothetical protein
MRIEEIKEPIEVITYYDGKTMKPIRFRWRGKAYHVSHINGIWDNPKGRHLEYHFHVTAKDSGSFELIYNDSGFIWKVGRICVDE